MQQLEERLRRLIIKSRPYFEEKAICLDQLNTQRDRIEFLQKSVSQVKFSYSQSLKALELISEEIHQKRKHPKQQALPSEEEFPPGPREPGVGAELNSPSEETCSKKPPLPDITYELDRCDINSLGSLSAPPSSAVSEKDENEIEFDDVEESELIDLKQRVKQLAIRPVYGGEGCSSDHVWESELNETVNKLDHIMLMQECAQQLNDRYNKTDNILSDQYNNDLNESIVSNSSTPNKDLINKFENTG